MAARTNKSHGWIQREGKLGGPGYTRKSVAARRKILRGVVKKYGYRSALGSIMALERSTHISSPVRKALEADRVFLRETFGAAATRKRTEVYDAAMKRARSASRRTASPAQQNIIVLLLANGFRVRGDRVSYTAPGERGPRIITELPKTLTEAKALVARAKKRASAAKSAARKPASRRKLMSRAELDRARRAAYDAGDHMAGAHYGSRLAHARVTGAARGNPIGIDDAIIAHIITILVSYLGKKAVGGLKAFNALPRDERRAQLIATLTSPRMKWSGPVNAYAAKKIAESPRLVEHLLDLIEEYGPAAAEHAGDFATTKLTRPNSLRIRTGRTATVTTYLNPAREECPTHGVPLLNGRCVPCEYEDDVGMKTNRAPRRNSSSKWRYAGGYEVLERPHGKARVAYNSTVNRYIVEVELRGGQRQRRFAGSDAQGRAIAEEMLAAAGE